MTDHATGTGTERSERAALPGNVNFRYQNTAILSVTAVDAPIVVTSQSFDDRLAQTYDRTGIRPGMLSVVAGIEERRWWPEDVTFVDAAVMAGAKAIAEAGIDKRRIALLIDSSVCRAHLEPSAAVAVHHELGLSPACMNFDLSNACLGFVNGMQMAATMIDAGHVEYALVVDGEGSRRTQERTLERLAQPDATAEDVWSQFASLTLGSGGTAMVLGRADAHPEGHRIISAVTSAATQHNELCVGTLDDMRTDSKGLFAAGVQLSIEMWEEAKGTFDWTDLDRYVFHQISKVHTAAITGALNIDPARVPNTFRTYGNIGPASVPFTLAHEASSLAPGDRVLLMGIGSGVNASGLELLW